MKHKPPVYNKEERKKEKDAAIKIRSTTPPFPILSPPFIQKPLGPNPPPSSPCSSSPPPGRAETLFFVFDNPTMEFKLFFVFLLLALAVVARSSSLPDELNWVSFVGDSIGQENEMLMDSEESRRILAAKRYISYGALKANRVPCGRRGSSYYNCQRRQRANPYRRGCNAITRCARYTD